MNLIIFGPPASGKGTQAELLEKNLGMFHMEVGKLLREIAKINPRIREIVNVKGALVPDKETLSYIVKEIEKEEGLSKGVIFDGFPRSVNQYKLLKKWLAENQQKIDKAIFLDVSEKTIVERLAARRVCERCGTVYNLITNPPPQKNTCKCSGGLIQRQDDKPETIKKRLSVYTKQTQPLIALLEKERILVRINGEKPIEVISEDILAKLGIKNVNR